MGARGIVGVSATAGRSNRRPCSVPNFAQAPANGRRLGKNALCDALVEDQERVVNVYRAANGSTIMS